MRFDEKIWEVMKKIPKGKVTTYKELAKSVGCAAAARAVGNACNKNPYSPKIPCHRVVKSDGSLGGYAHGPRKKILLLSREGVRIKNNKILDFNQLMVTAKELK